MDQLYDLAVKCRNNSISKEELVMELRGGGIEDWVGAFGIVIAIIAVLNNSDAFQVHPAPGAIVPPHLQWLYGNQQPGNHFGYGKGAGPRSITIVGATQNAGSEKKQPLSGSWNYQNSPSYIEKIRFYDGYEAETLNSSLDHLLSKHGHSFDINDAFPLNPNQKPTKYPQIRTKISSGNRDQFRGNIKEFGQNSDLTIFKDLKIRGKLGRAYFCEETRRVVGISTEGPDAGRIIKAQPLGEVQINILRTQNRLD